VAVVVVVVKLLTFDPPEAKRSYSGCRTRERKAEAHEVDAQ